ncbi:hypothetical protein N7475_000948 [Penicillium sp. IBT 31633x]|nr:hypothetical protein N7475_000948 [Penicillium sp. IBT 31633x]
MWTKESNYELYRWELMLTTSDVISDSHVPTTATLSVKNGKASTRLASRDTTDFSAVDIPKRTGLDPLEKKDTQSQDEDLQNSAQTQVIEDVLETTIAPNEETTQDLPKSEREVEDEGDTELEDQIQVTNASKGGATRAATNIKIVRRDTVAGTVGGEGGVLRRREIIESVWSI